LGADALSKLIVETARAAAEVAAARQRYLSQEFGQRLHELKQMPLARWDGTTFEPDQI
jgi:hypothetical protein